MTKEQDVYERRKAELREWINDRHWTPEQRAFLERRLSIPHQPPIKDPVTEWEEDWLPRKKAQIRGAVVRLFKRIFGKK